MAITFPQKNEDNVVADRPSATTGTTLLHNLSAFLAVLPSVTGMSQECTGTKVTHSHHSCEYNEEKKIRISFVELQYSHSVIRTESERNLASAHI